MASAKISALTNQATILGADEFAINSAGVSKRVSWNTIRADAPGKELDYVQITATVNIVSTTEATGTTIITSSAVTFDGAAVIFEFFSPSVTSESVAADQTVISLFEGATQIGRLATIRTAAAGVTREPCDGKLRFTPTAGVHTYTVTAFSTATTGTPAVGAGLSGTGNLVPAYSRIVKV